jgi:glycosyltransferase involved in cell wall biosynthesis
MKSTNKKKILAVIPGLIPSTILGVIKPLLQLQRQGEIEFRVVLDKLCWEINIRWADILVLCRNCTSKNLWVLYWAQKHKKKVVYELDDNFFQISLDTDLGRYHRNPVRLFVLRKIFECCDRVNVYSESLYDIASQFTPNVKKIQPYFDFNIVAKATRRTHLGTIKVAYSTSRIEHDALSIIFETALRKILEAYPRVQVFIWGHIPERLRGLTNVRLMKYEANYNRFVHSFYQEGFDIGLAPMIDDEFHRSKTNNKFREYGGCEVAGIYSNVPLYAECVQDGVTGLLVDNTEAEWQGALERLILDDKLRNLIRVTAKEYVKKHYSYENTVMRWRQTFEELEETKTKHQSSFNGVPTNKVKAAIIVDEDCINQIKVKFSRLNLLLEAFAGLNIQKHFLAIPKELSKQLRIQFFDKANSKYSLLVCLVSDPVLRQCCLYTAVSTSAPVIIDFSNNPLTDFDQFRYCSNRNLRIVTSRNNKHHGSDEIKLIRDISPKDLEVYYSLYSPVCNWMEMLLDLKYRVPSSNWPMISFMDFSNAKDRWRHFSFSTLMNFPSCIRYSKQICSVVALNFRKKY